MQRDNIFNVNMELEDAFTVSVHDKKNKKHRSKTFKKIKGKPQPSVDQVMDKIKNII